MPRLIVTIPDRRLSRNFRLYECLDSGAAVRHGLDNTPPPGALAELAALIDAVAQPLRGEVGRLDVSGGIVNDAVNEQIRADQIKRYGIASRTAGSQHRASKKRGAALDLVPAHVDRWYLWGIVVGLVRAGKLPVDQGIIYEHKPHIHLSHRSDGDNVGDLRYARKDGRHMSVWSPWA